MWRGFRAVRASLVPVGHPSLADADPPCRPPCQDPASQPGPPPPNRGDPSWTSSRSSCCARSRSATSGSSGCGSPTCSATSSRWRSRRPSSRAPSARGSASTARPSRASPGCQEADMLAMPDPATFQVLPWRGEHQGAARMFCDITMPDGEPVVRRPALRAQAHAGPGRRPGLHLLHAPRDRVLPVQGAAAGPGEAPVPVDEGGYFDHDAPGARPRLPPRRRSRCSRRWASPWSSATTRAARASRRSTCATPTR